MHPYDGNRRSARSPSGTTGTFAIVMPSVVPTVTATIASKRAASITVAICFLSPISARKNASEAEVERLAFGAEDR